MLQDSTPQNQTINIDPYQMADNQQEPIQLEAPATLSPALGPEVIDTRSFKVKYGLDTILKKSYDEIYSDITQGNENALRDQAASEINYRKQLATEAAIQQMAQNKGDKLAPAEAEGLRNIIYNMNRETKPETVFEEAYGKQYLSILDELADRKPDSSMWASARNADPALAERLKETQSVLVTKREIARTARQNIEAEAQQQGWFGWGVDQAKSLIPGYTNWKLRGNVPDADSIGLENIRLGRNLEEQRRALFRLPPAEMKEQLDKILTNLKYDNPSLAVEFAKSMEGMTSDDVFGKDMDLALDTIGLPIASGVKSIFTKGRQILAKEAAKEGPASAAQLALDAEKAVKDVAQSAKAPNASKSSILEGAGEVGEAAVVKTTAEKVAERKGMENPTKVAVDDLFSVWKQDEQDLLGNTGTASRELVTRIHEASQTIRHDLENAILNAQKVERLPDVMATEAAVRAIKEDIQYNYPGLRNAVLNIPRIFDEPVANVRYAEMHIGKTNGEFFDRRTVAENFRKVHGLMDFSVEQQGQKYYLKGFRPLNETSDAVRDQIGNTAATRTPDSLLSSWLGMIRTAEDTTSLAQRMNAKTATYAPSIAFGILQENAKEIKKLRGWFGYGNNKWKEFTQVLTSAQDIPDKAGKTGTFFDNIQDLQNYYNRTLNRLPDDQEIAAYFAFKRGMEIDRIYRNIAEHRFRTRVGAENHRTYATGPDGNRQYTNYFDGVLRKELPKGTDTVMIMGKKVGEERIANMNTLGKEWQTLADEVKSGKRQVIEVYNPEARPFDGFGKITANERVRYIISDKFETRALQWDHVLRRGGGHVEYDYKFYIKQPKITKEDVGGILKNWYEGDTTIMPIQIRAMGVDVAKHLDTVRQLLRANNVDAARDYSNKNLHIDWDMVNGWFNSKKMADGTVVPARLSLQDPIQLIERGQQTINVDNNIAKKYGKSFKDGTSQGSLARQYQVQYTAERDADKMFTLNNVGTRSNPLYQISDVDKIDPISTMNRALNRIASSNYLDDYKTFAVEHWLKEAAPYLDVQRLDQLRYSPFKYFNDPKFLKNVDANKVRELQTAHAQIDALVGKPSVVDSMVDNAIQKLIDLTYNKVGPNTPLLGATSNLSKISDPIAFMRGVGFHTKLGAFNIAQFFAQSMTYVNIMGVAGHRYATPGTLAAQLHFWSTLNGRKPIMEHLDKIASKMNIPGTSRYKPGEFLEAVREGEKTGFFNVGGEVAMLDNPYSNKLINTAFGQVLDSGTVFFKYGERNSKLGAWHVAFKEFRDANPTLKITDKERAQILERADLLNVNMSRASNSRLHTGVLSLPTQFYTYQLRATELFFSKRLTWKERARMAGVNMAFYGVPVGAGVTGMPITDAWRNQAQEMGYQVGDNFLSSIINEGIPAYLAAMVSGGGDASAGNWYNFGDRWGAKGFDQLSSILRGDKSFIEIVGGASGSTFKSTWEAMDGFWASTLSAIRDDDKYFPVMASDYMDILKEISSVNSADTFWAAVNTGRQLSKKGTYLDDISLGNAVIKGLTGLQSQNVSDLNRMTVAMSDISEKQKRGVKKFVEEYRKALQAQDNDNIDQANRYYTRAYAYLRIYGVDEAKIPDAVEMAVKDNESLVSKLNYDFYIRKAPDDKKELYDAVYDRQQRLNEIRIKPWRGE